MTALASKIIWALCAAGWYVIRYPHERRSRRTAVTRDSADLKELLLMAISLTGLGILPGAYVATGFGSSAQRTRPGRSSAWRWSARAGRCSAR